MVLFLELLSVVLLAVPDKRGKKWFLLTKKRAEAKFVSTS